MGSEDSSSASAETMPPSVTIEESKDSSSSANEKESSSETSEKKNPDDDESSETASQSSQNKKMQKISSEALHKSKDLLLLSARGSNTQHSYSVSHSMLSSEDNSTTPPPTMNGENNIYHPSLSNDILKTDPAVNNPVDVPSKKKKKKKKSSQGRGGGGGGRRVKRTTKEFVAKAFHPRRAVIQHHYRRSRTRTANANAKNLASSSPYIASPTSSDRNDDDALLATSGRKKKRRRAVSEESATYPSSQNATKSISEQGSSSSSSNNLSDMRTSDVEKQKQNQLELHRQTLAAAWITGRRIKRVRLMPSHVVEYPRLDDEKFFRWERYIAQLLLYYFQDFTARYIDEGVAEVPSDPATFSRYIERLVMATETWHSWLMDIRRLYRWEDPRWTALWYAVFMVLWYTQHVVGFLYAYVIFIVIKHRFYPNTVDSVRQSLDRSLNRGALAYRWGELVDRQGRNQWLEPLLDEVIPYIQMQVGDLAAFLEVLENFYHWRNPSKTAATLFFFASCLTLTIFGDMEFCMKVFWLLSINTFFLGWPVASRYPRYRFIVSPLRWIFWDIPSHPEWAIKFLQQHDDLWRAEKTRGRTHSIAVSGAAADKRHSESSDKNNQEEEFQDLCEKETITFRAHHRGRQGHLVLSSQGLRFVVKSHHLPLKPKMKNDHHSREEVWSYPFSSLVQMTKRHSPMTSKVAGVDSSLKRLELEVLAPLPSSADHDRVDHGGDNLVRPDPGDRGEDDPYTYAAKRGMTTRIETLDVDGEERDEIFNLIVGWSKARWQVLGAKIEVKKILDRKEHAGPSRSSSIDGMG